MFFYTSPRSAVTGSFQVYVVEQFIIMQLLSCGNIIVLIWPTAFSHKTDFGEPGHELLILHLCYSLGFLHDIWNVTFNVTAQFELSKMWIFYILSGETKTNKQTKRLQLVQPAPAVWHMRWRWWGWELIQSYCRDTTVYSDILFFT